MKKTIKSIINGGLAPFNLKVITANPGFISGVDLFGDLGRIIDSPSPVCFDVGANTGQTIDNLVTAFKSPRIYSFEPSKQTYHKLTEKNYPSNISLHNCALGSTDEEKEFINYENPCLSSFLPLIQSIQNEYRFKSLKETSREIVPVVRLDTFVREHEISCIDLLKIDTQGFDLEVLSGASQSLEEGRIKNILIELNFVDIYSNQASVDSVEKYLSSLGYSLIDYYEKIRNGPCIAWCTGLFGKIA